MLYTPPNPNLRLWDTWLIEADGAQHLFYLQRQPHEIGCSSIGHAVTRDWLNWETLPPVLAQGTGSDWDNGPLMTGMTLKHAGRYYLFYGAMVDRVQRIGLALSDDLIHWEKAAQNPVLVPSGAWYETDPSQALNYETAWRDPYVFYEAAENCFYAFWCARIAEAKSDLGGGCIAAARSKDLFNWELLPPVYVSQTETCLEVPEYFRYENKHYLTYTSSYHFGTPYPTADPYQCTGTFYLCSDTMLSGYAPSAEASPILNASAPQDASNYVGRSIPLGDDPAIRRFYYHNVMAGGLGESIAGSLALPKKLHIRAEGGLEVRYDPDVLTGHLSEMNLNAAPLSPDNFLQLTAENLADGLIEAEITALYAGLCFRMQSGREGMLEGWAVWIAPSGTTPHHPLRVILGTLHCAEGPFGIRPAFGSPSALRLLAPQHDPQNLALRVVLRGQFADVFVDDVLYLSHSYNPQGIADQGRFGAFYAGQPKTKAAQNLRVKRFLT